MAGFSSWISCSCPLFSVASAPAWGPEAAAAPDNDDESDTIAYDDKSDSLQVVKKGEERVGLTPSPSSEPEPEQAPASVPTRLITSLTIEKTIDLRPILILEGRLATRSRLELGLAHAFEWRLV